MNHKKYNTKYHHLGICERKEIEKGLMAGLSISKIAKALNRSKSTISREIRRGTVTQRKRRSYELIKEEHRKEYLPYLEYKRYYANTGQEKYTTNKKQSGGKYKLLQDSELIRYIEEKILREHWSPAAITEELKTRENPYKTTVCFKTIYNYIDKELIGIKNIDLLMKTRLKVKKRHIRARKRELGKSIEIRDKAIETREEFGHWEGDTVIGKGRKGAIMTLVERKTSKGIILMLEDKSAKSVMQAMEKIRQYPIFKSITFDNGSEFARCGELESAGIQIYYAHPYSAYERGINENYNRMIRRFIPKGKDISKTTQEQLNRINNWIDTFPRKRLNYQTAEKVFNQELKKLSLTLG